MIDSPFPGTSGIFRRIRERTLVVKHCVYDAASVSLYRDTLSRFKLNKIGILINSDKKSCLKAI